MRLALTPDHRWQIGHEHLVAAAHQAGFEGLGTPADAAGPQMKAVYDRVGVTSPELLALRISDNTERTLEAAASLAKAAEVMAAPWVCTVFSAAPTGETAGLISRCAAMLAEAGSAMAVEFSPLGPVAGIREGLDVVDIAGHGAGLLVDSWHFSVGPSTWEDLQALPSEKIAYIQFSDGFPPASADLFHETMDRRVLPGEGVFELTRFVDVVRDNGFDGWATLELLNDGLGASVWPDLLSQAHASMKRYWAP